MKTKFHTLGILAVVALSAVALAADGFSIARKPKEGDVRKYKMKADIDLGGMAIQFNGSVQEKITKVEADGTYTLEQQQLDGKVSLNGQEQDVPNTGGTTTETYNANGVIKKITGDDVKAEAYRMATLGLVYDPGKPLNVNDTWTYEVKEDKATGAVAAKAEYKLLGEEKVGNRDTLKLKATIKETAGSDPASSDGTVWIDKADGSLVKLESKWVNAPFPGAPAPLNATVKLERIEK